MKLFVDQTRWMIFAAVVVLLAGCKQPETIVVNEAPTVSSEDTSRQEQPQSNQASFRQLVLGEYNAIKSLDPLLAENASEMRAVQLVYEGLVRFNATGSLAPGLAQDWSISDDSLRYAFTLRRDIFYHDSNVFSTGTGRRMTPQDIKFVFERMAQSGVSPRAADMFMNIRGFEPYFQEQRFVYNPQNRNLKGVAGILTPNDTTVVFELENRDPDFLKKLATPLAVVYPREAVGRTVEAFTPVGTGPFMYSQKESDGTFIFTKYQNYYGASEINLNRVDIESAEELALLKSMSSGDIHLLPQLGPELLEQLLTDSGDLMPTYAGRYDLQTPEGSVEFELHYNPGSNLSAAGAQKLTDQISTDSASWFYQFPGQLVSPQTRIITADTSQRSVDLSGDIYSAYSEDPFVRQFLGNLSKKVATQGVRLQMMQIRAPSRETGLFFTQNYPLIPDKQWRDYKKLFSFEVRQAALLRSEIEGLAFNQYLWWFNPRGITLPAVENL